MLYFLPKSATLKKLLLGVNSAHISFDILKSRHKNNYDNNF